MGVALFKSHHEPQQVHSEPTLQMFASSEDHRHSDCSLPAGSNDQKPTLSDCSSPVNSGSSGYISEEVLSASAREPEIFRSMDWNMHIFDDGKSEKDFFDEDLQSEKIPAIFHYSGAAETVFVSGSYDGWKEKTPLVRSDSGFCTIINVPQGTHQYKYFADGRWSCNPKEPKVTHESGAANNLLTVKSSDFEVFEALDADNEGLTSGVRNRIPPGPWSQQIPVRPAGPCTLRSAPPHLPPHLLDTILNKDTPQSCDPAILQEPRHVIVNHLYTQSIKDGVIVLGVTHRYRKKYVTTLIYRPT